MTDREPTIPADPPPPLAGARTAIAIGPPPNPNPHPESALKGDGPPMSLTLAPRPPVRAPATDDLPADPVRAWLSRISIPGAELSAFVPSPCSCTDLTIAEAEVVGRAVACPDLFVIHAPDFTVRERVVVAIAGHFVEAGRCLVLSPNPIAADRIAERLAKHNANGVARALAEDENPVRPSPTVAKVTSAALAANRIECLKRDAGASIAAADARLTCLEKLTDLVGSAARLDAEIANHLSRRDGIEAVVRSETETVFAAKVAEVKSAHDELTTRLTSEIESLAAGLNEKQSRLTAVRLQHAEAVAEVAKKPGFLARLFGKGQPGSDPAELEKQILTLEADISAIAVSSESLKQQIAESAVSTEVDRERLLQCEIAARQAELDSLVTTLTSERDRIRVEAEALAASHDVASGQMTDLADAKYSATLALVHAKELAAEVERTAHETACRQLIRIPVVVGTPGSLHVDPVFDPDPANDGGAPFSLLILDQAEELSEMEFVQLAKLATRWILIGEAATADEPKPHLNGSALRNGPARNGRPIEVPFMARLARLLDREVWVPESDRLVCRLVHATPDQRRGFVREPLLDRPEIELRFLTDADGQPALAEVAFPAAAGIASAKSFLFHQLGEVLLRPFGVLKWEHTETCITACWPQAETSCAEGTWIDLEPGVRERVVGTGATALTAAVTFDPAAEWDADRALAWITERLRPESNGRFAVVPRPSRG